MRAQRSQSPPPALINESAERAVLALILKNEDQWWDASANLKSADFAIERHQEIWRAMNALKETGRQIAKFTLLAQIGDQENSDAVGIGATISALMAEDTDGTSLRDSVDSVLHAAGRRYLVDVGERIKANALSAAIETPIDQVKQQAIKLLDDNSGTLGEVKFVSFLDAADQFLKKAESLIDSGKRLGISSGLRPFDALIGPMLPGELIILGGETGMGKSALATEIAALVAAQGIPVCLISMEMTLDALIARLLAHYADVSSEQLSSARVTKDELNTVFSAADRAGRLPLYICDEPAQTVSLMQARLASMQREHRIQIAIIDHLQHTKPEMTRQSEHEQVAQCVNDAQAMAKRLGIPVILISHLHRANDDLRIHSASDIRLPRLRDLHGSSAIEKAADAVLFVHRPHYFLTRAMQTPQVEADKMFWEGKAQFVLQKRRGGKGYGIENCFFHEKTTWFDDNPEVFKTWLDDF